MSKFRYHISAISKCRVGIATPRLGEKVEYEKPSFPAIVLDNFSRRRAAQPWVAVGSAIGEGDSKALYLVTHQDAGWVGINAHPTPPTPRIYWSTRKTDRV
jgi:hypothetical protein